MNSINKIYHLVSRIISHISWFLVLMAILIAALFFFLICFFSVMISDIDKWWAIKIPIEDIKSLFGKLEKYELLTFLGFGMGGVLLAMQAVIANRRASAMINAAIAQADAAKQQAKANYNTEQGQRQERLKNAIEHLGHASASVRLGGAYEMFHLAEDDPDSMSQTVLDILCAHIRDTTCDDVYQAHHAKRPSEEIQSLLTLLFVRKHKLFHGLRVNLEGARLNGAKLGGAQLQRAHLYKVQLQNANLISAQLQEAELREAQLQHVWLNGAQLQGAFLVEAYMQEARLAGTQLQGACLDEARLQGAKDIDVN